MIRPAVRSDSPAIIELSIATGLFLPDEVEPVHGMLDGYHSGQLGAGHEIHVWVDQPTSLPVGVVYFGMDQMTDRKWDLWMIAVAPDRQKQGIGSELIRFVERRVRQEGGRLLLIDTSSHSQYDPTRKFYVKHGYTEVARIPDFYSDGVSKVVNSKRISTDLSPTEPDTVC
jgi:ribosomal protein S18 acetylase RimI-like enzyme